MGLTRKFLEAMGLEDSKIQAIIEEHDKTVNGLKELRDKYKDDAEKLPEIQKKLDDLQNKGGEDWQKKYNDLDQMFKGYKAEVAGKEKTEKIRSAYTELLKAANVDSKRIDAILRVTDFKDMKLGEDGKLEDADKLTEGIKSGWSAFVTTTKTKGTDVETPPNDHTNVTKTRDEIYAKDENGRYKLSTSERQKAIAESLVAQKQT